MSSTEYIHNLSCDNIRVAGVGLEDTCVPNVGWINETYVAQSNINTSISQQFANKAILDGINQQVSTLSHPHFQSVTVDNLPASSNSLTAKAYVDTLVSSSVIQPGVGLTKTANILSVDASLPHLTQVGSFLYQSGANDLVIKPGTRSLLLNNNSTGDTYLNLGSASRTLFYHGSSLKMEVGSFGVSVSGDLLCNVLRKGDNAGVVNIYAGTSSTGGSSIELYGLTNGGGGNLVLNSMKDTFFKSYVSGAFVNNAIVSNTGAWQFQNTVDASSSTSGALTVAGGLGVAKNLFVGQNVYAAGSAFCFNNAQLPSGIDMEVGGTTPFLNLGVNGRGTTQKPINTTHAGAMLRVCPSAPTQAFQFFGRAAGSGTDNMVHSIALDGTTSIIGSGTLLYPNGNTGSPTLVTRTPGTRIVLYPNVNATESDYALGINGGELWNSVANSGAVFRWYHGNNPSATLSSTALTMNAVTLQCANVNAPGSVWGSGLKLAGSTGAVQDNTMTSWHRVGRLVTVMGKVTLTGMTGGTGGVLEINLPQAHCAQNYTYKDITVIKNNVKYNNPELNCASTSVYATLTDGGSNLVIVAGDSLFVRFSYISI